MKKTIWAFVLLLLVVLPLHADRLFTSGFEENNLTATMWTVPVGSPTIVTTSPHGGTYALESPGSANRIQKAITPTKTSGSLFVRAYFNHISGTSGTFGRIFTGDGTGGEGIIIHYQPSTGFLRLINSITSTTVTGTFGLSTGTWYRLELEVVIDDTTGTATLNIYTGDSATIEETLSIASEDTLPGAYNAVSFGNRDIFGFVSRFDDIAVNDDAGSAPQNTFPGPGKIFLLKPSGDNTVTWTKDGSSPAATNFEGVDDVPGTPDDGTTYNSATTNITDKLDLSNLGAEVPSDADIVLVDVYGRQGSDGTAGTRTILYELWDEADANTTGPVCSADLNGWRIADTDEHLVFDAGSRTKANIDSFRVGYSRSIGGSNEIRITAQWVNVEWIEATAAVRNRFIEW